MGDPASGTVEMLERHGYSYEAYEEPAVEPPLSSVGFEDVHPGFSKTRLKGQLMYEHQERAYRALVDWLNVIMVSGTGSGKTEAWIAAVAHMARQGKQFKVIAVYPTLALAWDQLSRLEEYSKALGLNVVGVDSVAKREVKDLRSLVRRADVVATNPAMLLHELKKHLVKPGSSVLSPAIEALTLLVIDELDFYDPRSLALLLGMIEILSTLRRGDLQVAVLTATLSNPEDLASFLEQVTGRGSVIVPGRPFRRANKVVIVLGKDLEGVRRAILDRLGGLEGIPGEIASALRDPARFREEAFKVVGFLQALGYDVPSITLDPLEILEWYALDKVQPLGVTLVFTPGINAAERVARALRERLGGERSRRVAAHHHLVPKHVRAEIEEAARRGEVRVIVTPRTLVQGIDIGTVVRIVHLGLPGEHKEFVQREGRKGRRRGIPFTESVIIPYTRWDRELLSRGLKAFREWVSLPLERVTVNPRNHYKTLLTGAAKLLSPLLQVGSGGLDRVEEEALRAAGVIGRGGVDAAALERLWNRLGFYEYGPPYGVKRVLEGQEGRRELEEIGRCDLVEKFQPGCIDYSEDAIVVDLLKSRGKRGVVVRVVEAGLREALARRDPPWLLEALEEYRHVKESWGDKPLILRDLASGLLASEVEDIVYPPRDGFGLLRKRPHRCMWRIYGSRLKAKVGRDGKVRVYRDASFIPLDAPVAGEYRDYTYGITVEGLHGYPPELIRLGLATLSVYLRRALGIPLGLLKYSVYAIGEKRVVEVHEETAAGLIPKIDWSSVSAGVSRYESGDLDEILLLQVDEYAYQTLESTGYDWSVAREAASRVASLIASYHSATLVLSGLRVRIPKPSRSLGVASIASLAHPVEVEGLGVKPVLAGVAYYDGSSHTVAVDLVYPGQGRPPESLLAVEMKAMADVEYEGFTLVSLDPQIDARELRRGGLRMLANLVESRAKSLSRILTETLGVKVGDPSWILDAVEFEDLEPLKPASVQDIVEVLEKPLPPQLLKGKAFKAVEDYLKRLSQAVYLAYLAAEKGIKRIQNAS